MKKEKLGAIACLFCLCCCGGGEKEIPTPTFDEKLSPIQFTIDLQKEVLPFPSTKSIPALDIPEPMPKNPEGNEDPTVPGEDSGDLYNRIDYIVYQAGTPDILIKHKQFTPQDPDFTIVYDSLPAGSYHICFLAHSDKGISIAGQTATFSKVADTFHLFYSREIQMGERVIEDISLRRIVSKIEFVSTDTVPKDLKNFTMRVSGYQKKIDLTTGIGISQDNPYVQTDTFQDSDIGKAKVVHSFFSFIPPQESTLDIHLTAINRIDEIIRERDINDVQPLQNRIIRYTGTLYTPKESDDTFTLDIVNEGKWDNPIIKDLED